MAFCRDRLTKELQSKKYSVVRLPRTGIEPLDIYGVEGKLRTYLGRVQDLWTADDSKNDIKIDEGNATEIGVTETHSMRLSAAFELLKDTFLAAVWDVPKVKTAYEGAKRLQIAFEQVTFRRANVLQLGKYLNKADLPLSNAIIQQYFFSGSAYAIVLTEVLRAGSIRIDAQSSMKGEVSIDVDALEALSNAKLTATANRAIQGSVTYKGSEPVTFAFKAIRLMLDKGMWTVEGVDPDVDLGSSGTVPVLIDPLDPDGLTDLV